MENKDPKLRPLVVLNGNLQRITKVQLEQNAQYQSQVLSIKAYKFAAKVETQPGIVIAQQPQDKHPIPQDNLSDILQTNPYGEGVIIEEFTRLISAKDLKPILNQLTLLRRDLPKMFSIRQHNTLIGLGLAALFNLTMVEAAQQKARSERAKNGTASKAPSTIKAASQKANAAKTRAAQFRAFQLRKAIQKIMGNRPDAEQSNHAAIARYLTEANVRTPSGKLKWQSSTVARVMKAAEAYDERTAQFKQRIAERKQKE